MSEADEKKRASYLTVAQQYNLDIAVTPLWHILGSFDNFGIYHVGSSLTRSNWRDVDLRCMMNDEKFDAIFGKIFSPIHLFFNTVISEWLSARTGLPVDFQFQRTTEANAEHTGKRNAIGIRLQVE